jgi:putative hydrolase of the HAD superfamily
MGSNGSGFKAVIFDYGKVLTFAPSDADWQALAKTAGVPVERFQPLYWAFRDAYDRAETNAAIYWRQVAAGAGSLIKNDAIITQLTALDNDQWTKVNPEMLEFARAVKRAGMKTAILSNMQHDMLFALRSKFEWLSEFDVQIFSCEIGMVKPHVDIYRKCCDLLNVLPANAAFLDDKMPNIEGAQQAGLKALLFNGRKMEAHHFIFNGSGHTQNQ